jgi:hypothetical protein
MNEWIMFLIGSAIGAAVALGIVYLYRWISLLKREIHQLYERRSFLILEDKLMQEFVFWKNEQKKQ